MVRMGKHVCLLCGKKRAMFEVYVYDLGSLWGWANVHKRCVLEFANKHGVQKEFRK